MDNNKKQAPKMDGCLLPIIGIIAVLLMVIVVV